MEETDQKLIIASIITVMIIGIPLYFGMPKEWAAAFAFGAAYWGFVKSYIDKRGAN